MKPPKEEKDKGDSWPLLEFAREHGRMKVHKNDQGLLDLCIFVNDEGLETKAYVAKSVGGYSANDILREQHELSIVMLDSGDYCLCKGWEVVRL